MSKCDERQRLIDVYSLKRLVSYTYIDKPIDHDEVPHLVANTMILRYASTNSTFLRLPDPLVFLSQYITSSVHHA